MQFEAIVISEINKTCKYCLSVRNWKKQHVCVFIYVYLKMVNIVILLISLSLLERKIFAGIVLFNADVLCSGWMTMCNVCTVVAP